MPSIRLHYLDFDFSDEDSGRGSFDAMAGVRDDHLPLVLAEIAMVLGWAVDTFGTPSLQDPEGEWAYEVQTTIEPDTPLEVAYDEVRRALVPTPVVGASRITLTLTLGGSPMFCDAFRARFGGGD